MKKGYRLKIPVIITMAILAMVIFITDCILELDYSLLNERSHVVYDQNGEILGYTLSKDSDAYRFYTKAEEVSPLYLKMLIANEDHRFYDHHGVDFLSLPRALVNNITKGRRTSGGSTIAMQVVKRLTGHERTYYNKLKEVVQALYITLRYGREEVLDWYLTLAPFGSNIEGVKAASLRWFGHLPKELTPSEAALLTALPRAPELIRPDRKHASTIYYKNEVLRLSYEKGVISKDLWDASIDDNIPNKLFPIKQNGKTYAEYLISKINKPEIYTYIDTNVQEILQNEGENFRLLHQDGAVLSAIVLDNSTHTITGVLGSSDLSISQICLPFARRSPGSTLKPFAYGLAFQEGKIFPNTLLHDYKSLFGTWQPQNFSRRFTGKVTASKALVSSLNLPALEVLNLVGAEHFLNVFNSGKKRIFTKDNVADASLILGSGTITLQDLAELYAMIHEDGIKNYFSLVKDDSYVETECINKRILVNKFDSDNDKSNKGKENNKEDINNNGDHMSDRFNDQNLIQDTKNQENDINNHLAKKCEAISKDSFRILSDDSARAIFEILKRTKRPANGIALSELSYKTGTSSRFTDALAVGSYKNYTVAVAIRFPDNKPGYHHYTGLDDASPVLFSIMQQLKVSEFDKPEIDSELLKGSLPEAFAEVQNRNTVLGKDELKIIFPSNGDTVMPDYEGRIFIKYKGGKGKIYLNYDDVQTEENYFIPEKEGYYIISILDEFGHSDTVEFKVLLSK